jgi:hypothetical protein
LSLLIETGIESAKQDIESTKLDFQEAKTVRKNRIEYDVLAKVINEQPDRKETDEKLSQLRKELNSLEVSSQASLAPVSWLTLLSAETANKFLTSQIFIEPYHR